MFVGPTRNIVLALAVVTTAGALRADEPSNDTPGAVYALTNSPTGNAVLVYDRGADGSLMPAGAYPTGGTGNGAGLGSQGAVIVSDDGRLLFAVNAGSHSISAFRIRPDGLEHADTEPSGGTTPVSVAFRGGLLYVLNAGMPNSVSGFSVGRKGELTPIPGATRQLSGPATNPAQVGFSDAGDVLVVTERATNQVDTFTVARPGFSPGRSCTLRPAPSRSASP
jgi:6-phosphogluconolactonase (cycloisomerase 2 family)